MAVTETPSPIPEIYRVFADFAQPSQYIEEDLYEPERFDYEEMLGGKPREHVEALDFGLVSWSPLGHLSPAAGAYLLPRLMELAESGCKDRDGDPFLMRFINYISLGPLARDFSLLGEEQRAAVVGYLNHVATRHWQLVKCECWDDVLEETIQAWSTT
ncbi:hypothetical protein [Mitsuaria sp. GD03876]|uniref:hypothetical protein n=1 Tax=Mitsuaria sp. GD03876 TaxID=2975399 RepID=UPI00244C622F|nr:hypothetical protein [Mitsuaria sp. GD03876]MDH0867550.1 hypothetical protein [Mitsuaria sp. GD03876]